LGFGSLPLRYRKQFLQALTGGNRLLRGIHGRHYRRCSRAPRIQRGRATPAGRP
jgi:hypothetical protein